jgi:uncharacterized integral membrane protein
MSSTEEQPQVQVQRGRSAGGSPYAKLIAPAVIAIVIIILILQNTSEDWRFHFFFWWVSLPAWLMLVALLAIGFLVGSLVSALLRRRRKQQLRRKAAAY